MNSDDKFFLEKNVFWKGISLTDSAAKQMFNLISVDKKNKGLKVGITKSGCAGFSYSLELIKKPKQDDLKFQRQGVILFVELKNMPFIDGTEIDYVYEGLNQVFKFNNPKAQYACGCGESFNIEIN